MGAHTFEGALMEVLNAHGAEDGAKIISERLLEIVTSKLG